MKLKLICIAILFVLSYRHSLGQDNQINSNNCSDKIIIVDNADNSSLQDTGGSLFSEIIHRAWAEKTIDLIRDLNNPRAETNAALKCLNFGEVKPSGWILRQMNNDLVKGFTGHLDELVPDLIIKDDIYGADRLTKKIKSKNLGTIWQNAATEVQYLWWNSETQSNWRDGFIRTAILTDNQEYLQKVKKYIDRILSTQDSDGYLGIYAPELRFNFNGENGELWAQSTLFRGLLGYYEATSDKKVLDAVERAVAVIMKAYPPGKSTPFKAAETGGGLSHGLTITDVFDRLYQITGDKKYSEYAIWLYEDYCNHDASEKDIQLTNLLNPAYNFSGHGAHTYEHLRALAIASYASEKPELMAGLNAYFNKFDKCITPGGGPIGDEWIGGRNADPENTGYEYCSLHELMDSYGVLMQKTGDMKWADRMEWLMYNAAQGARNPDESSIAYLKTDNSFSMTGYLHLNDSGILITPQTRYKYSPVHQDIAVCCVPNAGRIYPYFVKTMWMRSQNGIIAAIYGPCNLKTNINGVSVAICEETDYPFNFDIAFNLTVDEPVAFEMCFRKPAWAVNVYIEAPGAKKVENKNMIVLQKEWQSGDKIRIVFEAETKLGNNLKGDYYFSRGPLVFALPIDAIKQVKKEYKLTGFRDLYYYPKDTEYVHLYLPDNALLTTKVEKSVFETDKPWQTSIMLKCNLYNAETRKIEEYKLLLMGGTILRKVTFKSLKKE